MPKPRDATIADFIQRVLEQYQQSSVFSQRNMHRWKRICVLFVNKLGYGRVFN